MEYKVRRESETLMEKVFKNHARKGVIRTEVVARLLKELNPDMQFSESELSQAIGSADRSGSGFVDLEGFNKIAINFLIKQSRRDSDPFIFKHDVQLEDLPGGFRPKGLPEKKWSGPAQREKWDMDPFTYKNEIGPEDFAK